MDYTYETINCNLCKSDKFDIVYTGKGQHDIPVNVVICKKCGLSYLNPRWQKEDYFQFYQSKYDEYYRPGICHPNSPVRETDNEIIYRLKERKMLPAKVSNILDIGSGEGTKLLGFESLYSNPALYSIEPSPPSQDILRDKGIKVITSDVGSDWEKDYENKFDIVILRHVLEHTMDPLKILKKINNVLKKTGILYLAVPNCLNPTKDLRKNWFRVVHTYYFNKFSLVNLIKLSFLKPVHIIEGDELSKGELIVIAKKSDIKEPVNISVDHFIKQKKVFERKMKREQTISYYAKYYAVKVLKRLKIYR